MKEELVQRLLDIGGCGTAEETWERGFDDGVDASIDVVEDYFNHCKQEEIKSTNVLEFTNLTQLNENQQALVIWMQDNECSADDPLESISDLFLEGTPSEYFPDAPLSCVEAAYQSLNKKQKLELVQEYVKKALEQEEE